MRCVALSREASDTDCAAAALPNAKLYGPDGVCESGFVDPSKGGIPADVASRFKCTSPTLPTFRPPAGGPEVLHGLRGEVRREVTRSVLDLRL